MNPSRLSLSQGTFLLFLRRNRGFQSFALTMRPGVHGLALLGFVSLEPGRDAAEITEDGMAYAYRHL